MHLSDTILVQQYSDIQITQRKQRSVRKSIELITRIHGEKRVRIPHQVCADAIYHVDRIIPVKKLSL